MNKNCAYTAQGFLFCQAPKKEAFSFWERFEEPATGATAATTQPATGATAATTQPATGAAATTQPAVQQQQASCTYDAIVRSFPGEERILFDKLNATRANGGPHHLFNACKPESCVVKGCQGKGARAQCVVDCFECNGCKGGVSSTCNRVSSAQRIAVNHGNYELCSLQAGGKILRRGTDSSGQMLPTPCTNAAERATVYCPAAAPAEPAAAAASTTESFWSWR
jgi:hypothetical protein